MRWVVWLLVAFAAAVGLSLLMRFNHGNVAILWPPYRIEISVNLALALLAAGFVALHVLLIGTARALALPQRVRDYRARRRHEQATGALRDSVLAFLEGRHGRVERFAQTAQSNPTTAAVAALIAARSAQRMQEQARRDRWLDVAATDPGAAGALLMTQAELAVDERRAQDAIEIIERFHARGARHIVSLRTALRAYEQAERWDEVLHTLRLVEKRDALHPSAVRRLRARAFGELIERKAGDAAAIRELWRSLRADERACGGREDLARDGTVDPVRLCGDPRLERQREARLRPRDDLVRQHVGKGAAEDALGDERARCRRDAAFA
jgi:HemY protein